MPWDIEVLEVQEGFARIRMKVREEMLNDHGIVHGGISFSLADSTFPSNKELVALFMGLAFRKDEEWNV